ncbi:MAG: hypothetical protein ACK5LM_04660, partial [Lactovum sp.]
EGEVYCIDHLTRVKKISFDDVVINLRDKKYIQIFKEVHYEEVQAQALQGMIDFEEDIYLRDYKELVSLNILLQVMLKFSYYSMESFYPVSLDTSKLFLYFVDDLSEKISLFTKESFRNLSWFAYQFVFKLFKNIVFQNDYCIISKQAENYRILLSYPEENIFKFSQDNDSFTKIIKLRQAKKILLKISLHLENISGTYKIIREELSTKIIDDRKHLRKIKESPFVSQEDIDYYNKSQQPKRNIDFQEFIYDTCLDLELPIFGIQMIELQKVK